MEDAERRRALSDFYREEFIRHLQHLQDAGIVNPESRDAVHRAYRRFETGLEQICGRADFHAVAETLLQNFDTLTRLSRLDSRQRH